MHVTGNALYHEPILSRVGSIDNAPFMTLPEDTQCTGRSFGLGLGLDSISDPIRGDIHLMLEPL